MFSVRSMTHWPRFHLPRLIYSISFLRFMAHLRGIHSACGSVQTRTYIYTASCISYSGGSRIVAIVWREISTTGVTEKTHACHLHRLLGSGKFVPAGATYKYKISDQPLCTNARLCQSHTCVYVYRRVCIGLHPLPPIGGTIEAPRHASATWNSKLYCCCNFEEFY